MDQGLIHIYCGDGKGKTSAAAGLAVRGRRDAERTCSLRGSLRMRNREN